MLLQDAFVAVSISSLAWLFSFLLFKNIGREYKVSEEFLEDVA